MAGVNLPVIALDVETTGLSVARGDRICEIAVLHFERDGTICDRLTTLVNPGRHIPAGASCINGITDEMVRDAPCFPEVAGCVARSIRDGVLVIHNARFDISFLKAEFARIALPFPETRFLDTLEIARMHTNFFHFSAGRSLAGLANHFGILNPAAHRAEADALTAYRVLQALLGQLGTIGREPAEFFRFTRDIGGIGRRVPGAATGYVSGRRIRTGMRSPAFYCRDIISGAGPGPIPSACTAARMTGLCLPGYGERRSRFDRIPEVRENT